MTTKEKTEPKRVWKESLIRLPRNFLMNYHKSQRKKKLVTLKAKLAANNH